MAKLDNMTKDELNELLMEEIDKNKKLKEKVAASDATIKKIKDMIENVDKNEAYDWQKETLIRLTDVGLGMSDLNKLVDDYIKQKKEELELEKLEQEEAENETVIISDEKDMQIEEK